MKATSLATSHQPDSEIRDYLLWFRRSRPEDPAMTAFCHAVSEKMERGAREYGAASYALTQGDVEREAAEELVDVPGWLFFKWRRSTPRERERLQPILRLSFEAWRMLKSPNAV